MAITMFAATFELIDTGGEFHNSHTKQLSYHQTGFQYRVVHMAEDKLDIDIEI